MAAESPPNRATRLPYIAGLDGLRAIAVAGVLLYHGGGGWVPGGFLGVDVFFALSGYLITSLLLAELRASGRIDLRRFWVARARRLLPAALLVIGVVLLVAAVLLPGELARARGDAIASALYVNNWHQILAERSYLESFGRPSLLLHLWSLSIEEQFYLLWPLALGLGLRRLGAARTAALTAAAALASVGLMALLHDPAADPSRVYYGTDTRAFTLLAGALLAFAWPLGRLRPGAGPGAGAVLDVLGVAALGVVALAMLSWHDYDPWLYPGGLAAVAAASVVAVAAVVHPSARIGLVLGVAPLRWIGRRSYGIYLWHWPVMALTRPGLDVPWSTPVAVAVQVAATVALAELSFRYVEQPIRRGVALPRLAALLGRRPPRQRLGIAAAATAALLLLGGWAFARPIDRPAQAADTVAAAGDAPAPEPAASDSGRDGAADRRPAAAERPKKADRRPRTLAVGASVMLAAEPELRRRLGRRSRIDAAVSRQPGEVIDRLEEYRRDDALPARVVVQIGDNGPLWWAEAERLRAALAGVERVVLVTVRVPRSWEGQVNEMLAELDADWPEARIADWHAASARPDLLSDGAHPGPEGDRIYAATIARALR